MKNTEKYITFSAPIIKEHNNGKPSIYKLKFIDSYRFMQDSLSNHLNNLSGTDNKEEENEIIDSTRSMMASLSQSIDKASEINNEISRIDQKEPDIKFIDSMRSKMDLLCQSIDKVSDINNKISRIEKFANTDQLCHKDHNKSALLLRKGIYPYEYMDSW